MKKIKLILFASALLAQPMLARSEDVSQSQPVNIETLKSEYVRPTDIPAPEDNKQTSDKIALGKMLYFDPRLSQSGDLSCATCHNPAFGWQDGLSTGRGHKGNRLGRHSPTILNLAWAPRLFWDGRATTLEEQAKGPMLADAEMGMTEQIVLKTIKSIDGYRQFFSKVFPENGISLDNIAKAISAYERTIVSPDAPFDKWIKGDETALSEAEKRGFVIYNTKAQCSVCHSGWRFTDDGFHDIGLKSEDSGRAKIVQNVPTLSYAFKTPTLRNIVDRAPYMHDGSIATLHDVVRHYEDGFIKRTSLAWGMTGFRLTDQERDDLVAFLGTISSYESVTLPNLPPITNHQGE
jgi:cytochrome c peroxidase